MICEDCDAFCLRCPMYQEILDLKFFGETMFSASRAILGPPKNGKSAFDCCIEVLDSYRRAQARAAPARSTSANCYSIRRSRRKPYAERSEAECLPAKPRG